MKRFTFLFASSHWLSPSNVDSWVFNLRHVGHHQHAAAPRRPHSAVGLPEPCAGLACFSFSAEPSSLSTVGTVSWTSGVCGWSLTPLNLPKPVQQRASFLSIHHRKRRGERGWGEKLVLARVFRGTEPGHTCRPAHLSDPLTRTQVKQLMVALLPPVA